MKSAFPKLSVFGEHIIEAANKRGISIREMSQAVLSWGISGVDLWAGNHEKEGDEMLAAGMKCASVIFFTEFGKGRHEKECAAAIAYAKHVGSTRIMLVPGFLSEGENRDDVWGTTVKNIASFIDEAASEGLEVNMEDFGLQSAIIGSAAHIRRVLAEIPLLGHVLDTGNYAWWGDDVLAAAREFLPRIRHVHLKDNDKKDFHNSVVLGTGSIPFREIFDILAQGGYNGYCAIECFGVPDMYEGIRKSAEFCLKAGSFAV